ncbi:MAG: nitroreductase family protein [Planctomycetota bacterium]
MSKTAQTKYPILDCLADRWSPRAFAGRPVEREKLQALFEAARWAASAFNEQPWRFVVATKDQGDAYDRVLSCLVEANQAWAKAAPVLGITAVSQTFKKNGKDNRCAEHDLGLAMGNLSAQATALGLVVHQMAGIDQDAAMDKLNIPDGFHAFSAFSIGYAGDPEALPEGWMRDSETSLRDRNGFDEFVFGAVFGEATCWF